MKKYSIKEQTEVLKQMNNFVLKSKNIQTKGLSFYKDGNKLGKREINKIKKNASTIEEIFRKRRRHGVLVYNINHIKSDYI